MFMEEIILISLRHRSHQKRGKLGSKNQTLHQPRTRSKIRTYRKNITHGIKKILMVRVIFQTRRYLTKKNQFSKGTKQQQFHK